MEKDSRKVDLILVQKENLSPQEKSHGMGFLVDRGLCHILITVMD